MASSSKRASPAPGPKTDFVKRARDFANRAQEAPGVPVIPAICVGVAVIAALAGAFGTDFMPAVQRFSFWFCLMAFEGAKWLIWLKWRVREPKDYWPAALIGTPVLALSLPFEIWLSYRLVGEEAQLELVPTLLAAVPIGLTILALMTLVHPPQWRPQKSTAHSAGLMESAGIAMDAVLAVSSEDHYCRLYLKSGEQRLIAARLADLIDELQAINGAQIHRSHWIADAGVQGARRVGRGWAIALPCGTELRVSASYREEAKQRGWFSRGMS